MADDELKSVLYALFIQVSRCYDILLMNYAETAGFEKAMELRKLHEKDQMWAPPPYGSQGDDAPDNDVRSPHTDDPTT